MSTNDFVHFDSSQSKRRRARLACIACHQRKVKCDIQQRRKNGDEDCTPCTSADRACHLRPSRREAGRKGRKNDSRPGPSTPDHVPNEVDPLLTTDMTFEGLPTPVPEQNADLHLDQHRRPRHSIQSVLRQPSSPHNAPQSPSPDDFIHSLAPTNPTLQSVATHISDVDSTGFVKDVYRPEHLLDAENQALVAQLEHRYSSVLQPELEQIFTETYFSYCYPWCPVLDCNTLSDELARSPLLANALALASSHVQPPLLPHDGPSEYYKRARTIFYDDEESDDLTTLKAICLFYWWAPRATATPHRHSSWYVQTKIAYLRVKVLMVVQVVDISDNQALPANGYPSRAICRPYQ